MAKPRGVTVRVLPEVEEIVKYLSERLGYERHVIRNVALAYGLLVVASGVIPRDDQSLLKLIEYVRRVVRRVR